MIIQAHYLINPGKHPVLKDGCVVIQRGTIVDSGKARTIINRYPNQKMVRLGSCVLLPGLINIHTHLELPPLLDSIRTNSFPDWVLNLVSAKKGLQEQDYKSAARKNVETLILSGTTTVGEISTHDSSTGVLKQSGLRGIVFREIISINPKAPVPDLWVAPTRSSSLIRYGLSPHAPQTVSEQVLRMIKRKLRQRKLPLCMHVAESRDEIALLRGRKSGFSRLYARVGWQPDWAPRSRSPFVYLHDRGLMGPGFLAVHAVQATDEDIRIIKRSGTPVAHCPRSNKETGVGRMQLSKFLAEGICVGLGTDSLASSPTLNIWDEMRYAYRIHRNSGITAKEILNLATVGGAHALGLGREVGMLEPGKRADIIAVPLPSQSSGDIYSDLLRETNYCIMSMVNGKIIRTDEKRSSILNPR